jgi:bacillolysin
VRALRIFAFVSSFSLFAGLPAAGAGKPPGTQQVPPAARVALHQETGKVRFMGSAPGRPIPRPTSVGASASSTAIARAFLQRYGRAFGVRDQLKELRVISTRPAPSGRSVVRFQQEHGGVPVIGGELVVNLDADGDVLSASGEALPGPRISVEPVVTASEARRAAIATVAGKRGARVAGLVATAPSLWIYDSRILGGPGLDVPTLVWRMDVRGEGPIDELVLVDARLGNVVVRIDQIEEAKDRRICDANNTSAQYPCTSPVRTEGGPASGVADVNAAYDFSGDTYDFFFTNFGRDSLDGAGMILFSTVRFCPSPAPADCPYQNAFWDGAQMVYGAGFAVDDVVGHELTHGVTEFTSHLFYYYQSGAINESLSDVFGEFVDLTNGADLPADRWLLGEDIPGIGAIRDMENPPAFGDPDRMTSPNYTADPNETDGGGVHTNSGVNNKAAFLITDGATFNGQTVTGLGITKAAHVYYEASTNLLTSASDYADLATALPQACTNKIGTAGITAGDCTEVSEAVLAVEMAQSPPAAPNPEAPVCSPGESPAYLFFDDLENPASGNWALQTGAGTNRWFYPQNPNTIGLDATYATSGTTNFWGYDQPVTADYSIRMTGDVAVPVGSVYLRFRHAYGFEDDSFGAYDGGVLEYSTDGGSTWADAGSLFTHGGYTGIISSDFANPLGGRSAFVRESNGYVSSRADLSSLVGQNVRFRFRIGTDEIFDDYGWFVDDIGIYSCGALESDPPETAITAGPSGPTNDPTPTFAFTSDELGSTFACRVDTDPFRPCLSPHTTATLADGPHTFEVKAKDPSNNEDSTPASRSFAVDTVPPDTTITSGPMGVTTNPTPMFEFTSSEPSSTFECRVDGAAFAACMTPHTTPTLADGPHTFEVRATDQVGNQDPSPASRSFVVDTGPPDTTIISGPTGTTTDPTPTFEFTSDEPGSTFMCRVDLAPFAACTSPHTTGTLAEGPHTFEVKAKDLADNEDPTPDTRAFTLISPPSPSISIADAKKKEPDKGKKVMKFTVSLSGASTSPVTVAFATKNGTAKAPKDFKPVKGTLTFAPGVTSQVVKVMIKGDTADEKNEKFKVILSAPSGATVADGSAIGKIKDND